MAQRKKKKEINVRASTENYPTPQRMSHTGVVIRNNMGIVEEPLRIDKLLKNGIIDEMQHLYGMQIITLWTIASRPFLKAMQYQSRSGGNVPDFDYINISRMGAEDQFYKTMAQLKKRDHNLISKICFEEIAAIEAGRQIGLPVNAITTYVRSAFDSLGDALANTRRLKKEMEKSEEGVAPEIA